MKKLLLLSLIAVAVSLVSCHDTYTICDENRLVVAKMNFKKVTAGVPTPYQIGSFSLEAVNNLPNVITDQNRSAVNFQLFPYADSAVYIFKDGANTPDTLVMKYTSQNKQLSANCGFIDYHTINRITTTNHTIDSVKITNNLVDNQVRDNITLFF